jgi:uncharacterized protein YfaP (DUF2135 family)
MAVFFMYFLVPHKPEESSDKEEGVDPQGDIVIEMSWPYEYNIDIDLWVFSPKGGLVGYSNKGTYNCNLLRDDLGTDNMIDPSPINFESTVCRKKLQGEWVVNVNYYGGTDSNDHTDIPVTVVVLDMSTGRGVVAARDVVLKETGHEETAFRFIVDDGGRIQEWPEPRIFGVGDSESGGGD